LSESGIVDFDDPRVRHFVYAGRGLCVPEHARRAVQIPTFITSRECRAATSGSDLSAHRPATEESTRRPSILWWWLSRRWARWRDVLVFVQPETVIAWQRKRFRDHWTRMGRAGKSPDDRWSARRYASSSVRFPGPTRCGARRTSSASWESSASRWRNQRWTNTASDPPRRLADMEDIPEESRQ
jgi:hypothetical protein